MVWALMATRIRLLSDSLDRSSKDYYQLIDQDTLRETPDPRDFVPRRRDDASS